MKKKVIIITSIFALAITMSLMFNFHSSEKKSLSSITLKNAEALAQEEGPGRVANGPGEIKYCPTCMTHHTHCKAKKPTRCSPTDH